MYNKMNHIKGIITKCHLAAKPKIKRIFTTKIKCHEHLATALKHISSAHIW